MGWLDSFKAMFKNEVTIALQPESIVFQNERLNIKLKPFIIVTEKRIVLAVGEETATAVPSKKVEFLSDASLSDKERSEYLQTFIKFGLQKATASNSLVRPAVTFQSLAAVSSLVPNAERFFSDAAVSAGARSVAFRK